MPTFFSDLRLLAGATGGGQDVGSIDNAPIPQLSGVLISSPRVLNDHEIIYTTSMDNPPVHNGQVVHGTYVLNLITGAVRKVGPATSWVVAQDDVWGCFTAAANPTYFDSYGRQLTGAVNRVCAASHLGVLASPYHTGQGLVLYTHAGMEEVLPPSYVVFPQDCAVFGDTYMVRTGSSWTEFTLGTLRGSRRVVKVPVSRDLGFDGRYAVTWAQAVGLIIVDTNTGDWAPVSGPNDVRFYPQIRVQNGVAHVAYALTLGEAPGTVVKETHTLNALAWHTSVPVIVKPTPMSTCIKPWPYTLWIAPYQSYNMNQWGDTQDFVGNCIMVTDTAENTKRLVGQGKPMIVVPTAYAPEAASLVVGYYVAGHDVASLGVAVQTALNNIAQGHIPPRPIVAYLDARTWPSSRPAWLNTDVVWPSPQCYRNPGEDLAAFDNAIRGELTKLKDWGCRIFPTLHAYDRNGLGTEQEALEALSLTRAWADDFPFIGLAPFSDMRRGVVDGRPIGGMETYPAIRNMVRAMQFANPRERPNRWDGWKWGSWQDRILNKLSQSTEHPFLDEEDKQRLRDLVRGV